MTTILSTRLTLVVLLALSCAAAEERVAPEQAQDENEVRRLRQENEALRRQLKEKDDDSALREQYITQVTRSLNEVQDNLTGLTQKQQDLSRTYVKMIEDQKHVSVSQRDDLMQKIRSLRNELASTAAALKEARRQAEGDGGAGKARVVELVQLVEKLQAEVERRAAENETLHETVANLQLDIRERDAVIVAQQGAIEDRDIVIAQKEKENVELELDKYRVWYRIDTYDNLQKDHVIESRGGGWMLSRSQFDKGRLKEKHMSALPAIRIDKARKRLTLITTHAVGSYEMVPVSRHETLFRILKREEFWDGSPYLVIAVK